jgi:hypothetical protein
MANELLVWNERHKSIEKKVNDLFNRGSLLSLWQSIADNFYPERADFTISRNLGDEFADHLSTSYPVIIRRDLGDSIGGMLRPSGQDWFAIKVNRDDAQLDNAGKVFLEAATEAQRRAMYDRKAQFTKATKQGDHDYATFGQCVLSAEVNLNTMTLLYRNWHLKDVVWCEDENGEIDLVARKWKCRAADAMRYFHGRVHPEISKLVTDNNGSRAYEMCEFLHVVLKSSAYEYVAQKRMGREAPYVSLWLDCKNKFVMEEQPRMTAYYIIPRWQTVSGSQYAHSPATIAALPDARLIQAMTYTLLRASEKAVDPPLIAVQEMVRSDLATYPSGVTWVDADYDERLGEVLRPIPSDYKGLPMGVELQQRQMAMIETAFYINRLSMPPVDHEMTAEEARYRVQQYIRQALPLFEPIEQEYNAQVCEQTFDLLLGVNAFGPPQNVPESLQGSEVQFMFVSPLIEARDQQLARTFIDSKALIAEAAALDPGAVYMLDVPVALREALRGNGAPSIWLTDEATYAERAAAAQAQQEAMQAAATIGQGAVVAEQVGMAGQAIGGMGE